MATRVPNGTGYNAPALAMPKKTSGSKLVFDPEVRHG
jgi:hypothetical protein